MSNVRHNLIREFAAICTKLRKFGIRRVSDYAELLVAEAVRGMRVASGVNCGFDVVSSEFGRIEVKCRQLPPDGRREHRVEISKAKREGFDYLAIIVFSSDLDVFGAVMLPYEAVWQMIDSRVWRRISFDQATAIPGAINITDAVKRAASQ